MTTFGDTEHTIRARLATHPDDAEALRLLASIVTQSHSASDGEALLRRAVTVQPRHVLAYADLTSLLCREERSGEALALLDDVIAAEPAKIWPLSLKAAALDSERRTGEAIHVHEQLVTRASRVAVPWINYGRALQALGRAADAAIAFRRAIELDPANGSAWWGLANLRVVRLDERDIASLQHALEGPSSDLSRAQLHFALGKALGDHGKFERSFQHYEKGNDTRRRFAPYDAHFVSETVRAAKATFTAEFFRQRSGSGEDPSAPIFIIGMPRSGSSLVEQILASHPMVEGMGELFELQNLVTRIAGAEASTASWIDAVAKLNDENIQELGASYLRSVRKHRKTDCPVFTDKMPSNWKFAGLIQLILPNARIVDVRRDVMACGLSNFTTYFNRETKAPTTLREFRQYYQDYAELVAHVARARPGHIHHVRYENVVADIEGEVRRLLAYLDLPFDDACLRFHETQRAIHTPSAQQVRRQLNGDGLERWRDYESWLGPLSADAV